VAHLPFIIDIALRYVRGGGGTRRDRFISFISGLSMAGIGLGVAALIVVLSVMNGFQREVRDRMLSVIAHIEVQAPETGFVDLLQDIANMRRHPEVVGVAPFVAAQAMLTVQGNVRGVLVRGIDPALETQVSRFDHVSAGRLEALKPGDFGVALGGELARGLGVKTGDKITLIAPTGQVTPAGVLPRLRAFTVVAIFESGHYEYDSSLALINIVDAARLFRTPGSNALRIKIRDMDQAPRVARELAQFLPNTYWLRDWSQQNRTWFAAVQTEKRMMFLILTLIIAVAAFNLVSMLVMTVKDKRSDIAILRTLGASPGAIQCIFMLQGALVGWIGTAFGVLGGWLLAINLHIVVPAIERVLHIEFLPKSIYFISELPSDPRTHDILVIACVALVLSVLATIYPSWRAAREQPAQALRYE
jgi:lipoprotein-releasing system permease protein